MQTLYADARPGARVEKPAIERGRRKALAAFRAMPHRRHLAVTTTYGDYLALLIRQMPPFGFEWGLEQARHAVMAIALCRLHDDGSMTRRLVPVFPHNLPMLAADMALDEDRTSMKFEMMGRWSADRCGNIPADLVRVESNAGVLP